MNLTVRPLQESDFAKVLTFSDRAIGDNYFTLEKIQGVFRRSKWQDKVMSLVLVDENEDVHGIRLTYPQGSWAVGDGPLVAHPHLWKVPADQTAYFQSIFLSVEVRNTGWGFKMSMASIEELKKIGTKAIFCHSWDESPGNSSRRYLNRLGFEPVIQIKRYWESVPYVCTRCGSPCLCTATEMVLYL